MIVQMCNSRHMVSAYIIFFKKKSKKYNQKQKYSQEILIKNITTLERIYLFKVS